MCAQVKCAVVAHYKHIYLGNVCVKEDIPEEYLCHLPVKCDYGKRLLNLTLVKTQLKSA